MKNNNVFITFINDFYCVHGVKEDSEEYKNICEIIDESNIDRLTSFEQLYFILEFLKEMNGSSK